VPLDCSGMHRLVIFVALLFFDVSVPHSPQAEAQAPSAGKNSVGPVSKIDVNQPYVPVQTTTHPCADSDWKFLGSPSTIALLADYGYELKPPITCLAASVPWLPMARIIRVRESINLDIYPEFTLVQGSGTSKAWLIPIESGMVINAHTEDNLHHIAAFNDLLRSATRKPDENMLLELGNLYQFIVGCEQWFDPDRMPKTILQSMEVNDIEAMIQHDPDGIIYRHREFYGDRWEHKYMIWEFTFKESKQGLRLWYVERGRLDQATDGLKQK
jgi:hypothetical protein